MRIMGNLFIKVQALPLFFILVLLVGCGGIEQEGRDVPPREELADNPRLTLQEAERLAALPLKCLNNEYPNRLGQTLSGPQDLKPPHVLHPAFYGCFDWHSAVHGHWSLVSLLRQFPRFKAAEQAKDQLLRHLSAENIKEESNYFIQKQNKLFERTYGWAWLLKLSEELHRWQDPDARIMEENLRPLTQIIVRNYLEFLPKLRYPIRVGEHPNTAFGMSFAWDYAETLNDTALLSVIGRRARDFYWADRDCPIGWEPGGSDFLSPCLEEAALMKRILPIDSFSHWIHWFLPTLASPHFKLSPGVVSDRSDGKLVHLDGVNFSRAWCLFKISEGLPEFQHLNHVAYEHIANSLPNIVDEHYEGGHWLGSFAIYALNAAQDAN